MDHIWGAGPHQRAHEVGAVLAKHDDACLVLDLAEAVEKGGPRFRRLQRDTRRRATRRHRAGIGQHKDWLLKDAMRGPDWSQFMAGRKIDAPAYKSDQCRG